MSHRDEVGSGVTVGDLVAQLKNFDPALPVTFGPEGHFSFYRVKDRGGVVQIEFNEAEGLDYVRTEEHP